MRALGVLELLPVQLERLILPHSLLSGFGPGIAPERGAVWFSRIRGLCLIARIAFGRVRVKPVHRILNTSIYDVIERCARVVYHIR
jgi:hypothetical protein